MEPGTKLYEHSHRDHGFTPCYRLVLATTGPLHDTISDLRDRIRLLETALNDIHVTRTGHTHHLLASTTAHDEIALDEDEDITPSDVTEDPLHDTALIRGQDGAQRIVGAFDGKSWIAHVNMFLIVPLTYLTLTKVCRPV
jgi:hypothetical protein